LKLSPPLKRRERVKASPPLKRSGRVKASPPLKRRGGAKRRGGVVLGVVLKINV
jgi:hypothetical protein